MAERDIEHRKTLEALPSEYWVGFNPSFIFHTSKHQPSTSGWYMTKKDTSYCILWWNKCGLWFNSPDSCPMWDQDRCWFFVYYSDDYPVVSTDADPDPDTEFRKFVESLPPDHWVRYDLSVVRLGWDACIKKHQVFKEQVRQAVADYMWSEGCDCCQNVKEYEKAEQQLAILLDVPMYDDRSGYQFYKYKSES